MNYRRLTTSNKKETLVTILKASLIASLVALISFFGLKGLSGTTESTDTVLVDNPVKAQTSTKENTSSSLVKAETLTEEDLLSETEPVQTPEIPVIETTEPIAVENVATYSEEVIYPETTDYVIAQESTSYYYEPVTTNYSTTSSTYTTTLANGNTAGEIGSAAAAQMAAATGVPQETWEYIIARESNGNPYAANASGASGLFQTIPGWGSTATVEDQINTAIHVYNTQGMSAWGF